jgi:hypothetical protein
MTSRASRSPVRHRDASNSRATPPHPLPSSAALHRRAFAVSCCSRAAPPLPAAALSSDPCTPPQPLLLSPCLTRRRPLPVFLRYALTLTRVTSLRPSSSDDPSRDFISVRLFHVTLIFSFWIADEILSNSNLFVSALQSSSVVSVEPSRVKVPSFSQESRSSEVAYRDLFFSYLACLLS